MLYNDLTRGRPNRLRGYASFLRVYVTMRNREPGCATNLRNHT